MNPLDVTRGNILEYSQNKPSLIAKDLEKIFDVPRSATLKILMARGVFKWLSVRRKLIRLKNDWKGRIRNTIGIIIDCKKSNNKTDLQYWRGYLKAYEECRKEVRSLCNSQRWSCPDNDMKSIIDL